MRIVRPKEAAEELYISIGYIYWLAQRGRITRYPYQVAACNRRRRDSVAQPHYMVDVDEIREAVTDGAMEALKRAHPDKRLLRPLEVARITGAKRDLVYQWIEMLQLKKYQIGKTRQYLLDGDEIADKLIQRGLGHWVK